jgi:methylmalonyl-CoA mutase C-terminal domain/subunit
MAVARVLREAQMRVEYFGKFQTPASVAAKAIEQGADVVGISCHSWEYLKLVPMLIRNWGSAAQTSPSLLVGR